MAPLPQLDPRSTSDSAATPSSPRLAILLPASLLIFIPLISSLILLLMRKFSRRHYDRTAPYCPFRRTWAFIVPCLMRMKQIRYRNREIRARAKALSNSTSTGSSISINGRGGGSGFKYMHAWPGSIPVGSSLISWSWLSSRPRNFSFRHPDDGKWFILGPWRRSGCINTKTRSSESSSSSSTRNDGESCSTVDLEMLRARYFPNTSLSEGVAQGGHSHDQSWMTVARPCMIAWPLHSHVFDRFSWPIPAVEITSGQPSNRVFRSMASSPMSSATAFVHGRRWHRILESTTKPSSPIHTRHHKAIENMIRRRSRHYRQHHPRLSTIRALLKGRSQKVSRPRRGLIVVDPITEALSPNVAGLRRSVGSVTLRAWWDGLDTQDVPCSGHVDPVSPSPQMAAQKGAQKRTRSVSELAS